MGEARFPPARRSAARRSAAGCLVARHETADGEVLTLPAFHGDVVLITSDEEGPTADAVAECGAADAFAVAELRG